jgi:hypothetical protein
MSIHSGRYSLILLAGAVLSGCAGLGLREPAPAEITGHLSDAFVFTPCNAPPDDARWRMYFAGPAVEQRRYIDTARLLGLPQPLLVRVSGTVWKRHTPGSVGEGITRSITVTDILGMQLAGRCDEM